MASAVDRREKEPNPKKKKHSKELLNPLEGPGVCFLNKELSVPLGHSPGPPQVYRVGGTSIPPVQLPGPPQTYRISSSSILSQVKAFLPQLKEADKQLQERLQEVPKEQLDIEHVEEGDSCIQMDLAVVPLSNDQSHNSDNDDDSSDAESECETSSVELTKRTLRVERKTSLKQNIVEL